MAFFLQAFDMIERQVLASQLLELAKGRGEICRECDCPVLNLNPLDERRCPECGNRIRAQQLSD